MIKNQFGVSIKDLRSDNAKDNFNQDRSPFLQKEGIIHQSSCIDTPQQNGIVKHKNRHLREITNALLFQNNVPKSYWGKAVLTAAHLINRSPTCILEHKSPIQTISQFFLDCNMFSNKLPPKVFGWVSFVHIHAHNHSKLDPRALQ